MWLFIFIGSTLLLLALPLIPSFVELAMETDTRPLKVSQDYDIDVKHFAIGFRAYIEKNFATWLVSGGSEEKPAKEGALNDNTPFIVLGTNGKLPLDSRESRKNATRRLIVTSDNVTLPDKMLFESEVYSKASITTGADTSFRAALAEGDFTLGEKNTVFRWIHSGKTLKVTRGCHLFGRASSDETINITGNCNFERLNARKILFGQEDNSGHNGVAQNNLQVIKELPHVIDRSERRWLINGDVHIPAGSIFDGDIVATKSVTIGAGSIINGSVKSNDDLFLEEGSSITGAAVSAMDIQTESGCKLLGPVIAEGNIIIGQNNVIGSYEHPVTVSGLNAAVRGGAVIYGTIRVDKKAVALIAYKDKELRRA